MNADTHSGERQSILVIDDHPLFRKGVGQLLEMEPGFDLVSEAQSGEEGLRLAKSIKPDLILLDLNMKRGLNGLQVLKELKQSGNEATVVILTMSDLEEDLVAALRLGADGYLLKDMEPAALLEKIREALNNQMVLDSSLTTLLTCALRKDHNRGATKFATDAGTLTGREQQILGLIAKGLSNKRIAEHLEISDGTVKVHVKNLLRKLNLHSRLEAAIWALNQGFKYQPPTASRSRRTGTPKPR